MRSKLAPVPVSAIGTGEKGPRYQRQASSPQHYLNDQLFLLLGTESRALYKQGKRSITTIPAKMVRFFKNVDIYLFVEEGMHGPPCAFGGGGGKPPQVLLPSFTIWGPVIELRTSNFITRALAAEPSHQPKESKHFNLKNVYRGWGGGSAGKALSTQV